jgi:hypothetical protein
VPGLCALVHVTIATLLADAGYDWERAHTFARDGCGVRSVIPPEGGRPTGKLPSAKYRRLMRLYRDFRYGQRWQAETVMSMIKRRLGAAVAGRGDASRARDVMLKVITHNLMLIVGGLAEVFYGASLTPFCLAFASLAFIRRSVAYRILGRPSRFHERRSRTRGRGPPSIGPFAGVCGDDPPPREPGRSPPLLRSTGVGAVP